MEFQNDFGRNINNSSSSHTDNCKNISFDARWKTYFINASFAPPEKKFNFSKENTKWCLILHYNGGNTYFLLNGKEIFKFKTDKRNVKFPPQLCLESISNWFSATEFIEETLKGKVNDFSVDYNSIDKSNILNINKFLMAKNSIK